MTLDQAIKNSQENGVDPTIFIVDDDIDICKSLESLFRSLGYTVESFANGQEFLACARQGMLGCLLLDVRLPGISGFEVQRRLREAQIPLPIVYLTGHGDIEMAVAAMKSGAVEFLSKPFREQHLIDAVGEAFARSEQAARDAALRNSYRSLVGRLTARERELLNDLSSGLQIKQIADKYELSPDTVRVHRRNIQRKLGSTDLNMLYSLHNRFNRI